MGAFNEVIGLWSSMLSVFGTIVALMVAKEKSRKGVLCIGVIITLAVSIIVFCFTPDDKTVKEVVNNLFNNTYQVSDAEISNENISLSTSYKNYSICMVFREKIMYTVPLSGNLSDKSYEIYRDMFISDSSEVSIAHSESDERLSASISTNGHLVFNCTEIENDTAVNITYNNITNQYTFPAIYELPSTTWTTSGYSNLDLLEYLICVKNSNGQNVSDSIVYIQREGHEISLTTDESGIIRSYLFLSDGQYDFYTRDENGNETGHSTITVPSDELNETNTIILR